MSGRSHQVNVTEHERVMLAMYRSIAVGCRWIVDRMHREETGADAWPRGSATRGESGPYEQ